MVNSFIPEVSLEIFAFKEQKLDFFPLVIFVCQETFTRPTFSKWDRARHRWLRPSAPRWGHHPQVRSQAHVCLPVLLRKKAVLRAIKYVLWSLLSFLSYFQKKSLPRNLQNGVYGVPPRLFSRIRSIIVRERGWNERKRFPLQTFKKKRNGCHGSVRQPI